MNKPFLKAGYIGILVLIISAALMVINPAKVVKLPAGFFNPVVAFEFIRTEAEVYDLFGHGLSDAQTGLISSFKTGTYLDFLYMIVYSLFLLTFAFVCRRITGSKWFVFSGFIILAVIISDFSENIQLLAIMDKFQSIDKVSTAANLPSGGFNSELVLLNFFTWAKWGGLTALFISFIPFFRKSGRAGRIISVISLISALIGAAAFHHRSVLNEIYVLSIAVIFIMIIGFSFSYKNEPGKS